MPNTMMHLYAKTGNLPGLKGMIRAGHNPNTVSDSGRRPINYAAANGKKDCVEYLISIGSMFDSGNPYKPVYEAVLEDHVECVKLLLNHIHHLTELDQYELTELVHCCCRNNNTKCLRLLLEMGASPYTSDFLGKTPLYILIVENHLSTISILLEHRLYISQKQIDILDSLFYVDKKAINYLKELKKQQLSIFTLHNHTQ